MPLRPSKPPDPTCITTTPPYSPLRRRVLPMQAGESDRKLTLAPWTPHPPSSPSSNTRSPLCFSAGRRERSQAGDKAGGGGGSLCGARPRGRGHPDAAHAGKGSKFDVVLQFDVFFTERSSPATRPFPSPLLVARARHSVCTPAATSLCIAPLLAPPPPPFPMRPCCQWTTWSLLPRQAPILSVNNLLCPPCVPPQAPMLSVDNMEPAAAVATLRQALEGLSTLSAQRAALEEALKVGVLDCDTHLVIDFIRIVGSARDGRDGQAAPSPSRGLWRVH